MPAQALATLPARCAAFRQPDRDATAPATRLGSRPAWLRPARQSQERAPQARTSTRDLRLHGEELDSAGLGSAASTLTPGLDGRREWLDDAVQQIGLVR